MIKVYLKQPFQAEQFDGSDEMIDKYELIDAGTMLETHHSLELYLTESGKVDVGDWIETGVTGEHWTITDDVFKKTYAELPVVPHYVAEYINYMKSSYRDIWDAINYPFRSNNINKYMENNSETFARAWLDGYQVEGHK
ncbi:DUF1642 domain-containing protein [Lactiplantibacillus plantarum]|uniref:DUF1642 domain-containing protein n=1 Tax=Lactiplantibacillus plantarum TaxID=1590 RepID=UPI001F4CD628|nr:DUF1642 domain-containing protein [Lactiplantibacillus plantarum]MCH8625833.1 DUF1642 domain-containing protein [Lactiplantibacillus plantarum]